MDNRITKKRLSDFLSYEWILMIVIAVVAIVVWELAYTIGGVRLTVGQEFKYYYDQSVVAVNDYGILNKVGRNTFSYDVLKLDSEALTAEFNVLSVRLSIQEGDILFTDSVGIDETDPDKKKTVNIRAQNNVDSYGMYSLDELHADSVNYLKANFLKNDYSTATDLSSFVGVEQEDGTVSYAQYIDGAKLETTFRQRMKGDNRFRKEDQIQQGIQLETARINKLIDETKFFGNFLKNSSADTFFTYTKYEQSLRFAENQNNQNLVEQYKNQIEAEKQAGRENAKYGINLGAFEGRADCESPSNYFRVSGSGEDTAKNVVMMAFNFRSFQPHLQFETISFMNTIIRAFTVPNA